MDSDRRVTSDFHSLAFFSPSSSQGAGHDTTPTPHPIHQSRLYHYTFSGRPALFLALNVLFLKITKKKKKITVHLTRVGRSIRTIPAPLLYNIRQRSVRKIGLDYLYGNYNCRICQNHREQMEKKGKHFFVFIKSYNIIYRKIDRTAKAEIEQKL